MNFIFELFPRSLLKLLVPLFAQSRRLLDFADQRLILGRHLDPKKRLKSSAFDAQSLHDLLTFERIHATGSSLLAGGHSLIYGLSFENTLTFTNLYLC